MSRQKEWASVPITLFVALKFFQLTFKMSFTMSQKLNSHRSGGLISPTELATSNLKPDNTPLAVDMLLQCHQRVAAQCETLQRLCTYLNDHVVDDQARQASAAVMRYFDVAAPLHHADEEQDWWTLLRPMWVRDAPSIEMLDRLQDEHRQLESQWQALRLELQTVVQADPAEYLSVSRQVVDAFVLAYQTHIAFEEGPWMELASRSVSEQDLARLGERMTARRQQA